MLVSTKIVDFMKYIDGLTELHTTLFHIGLESIQHDMVGNQYFLSLTFHSVSLCLLFI